MDELPHSSDEQRSQARISTSPALPPSPESSALSAPFTPQCGQRAGEVQGRKRRRRSSDFEDRRQPEQTTCRNQHQVQDRQDANRRAGHRYEGGQASNSARVHNGDQYNYGPVSYHNHSGTDTLPQEQSRTPSQDDIARAMESLTFAQMDVRQASVRKAHANTCKWLFDRPEYNNWRNEELLSEHNGFFWIKSKPGAGKSTLMKFFLESASKQLPGDTIISFFFNARGEALEKSLDGMYRGLLHQLLNAIPRLQRILATVSTASFMQEGWPLDTLKSLFNNAVLQLGQDRVTCFVDALDECPEVEIRDMVDFFEELGESATAEDIKFSVCFSSRHYPRVTMNRCQHMVLDGQEGHKDDISKYVRSKLKFGSGKKAEEIRTALQDKAKGVFMWVVLVVRILNKESDRGSNIAELRRCLNRIPGELHELFEDILKRGMQDNRYLIPTLQWLSFARRPLTREELYFALRSGDADFDASKPWDPEEDRQEAMDLFILDSSKGLAESTKGKKPTMQFIHESVRDYLRDTGFQSLAPGLCQNLEGLSHDYLKDCCLSHIDETILHYLAPPQSLPKAKSEEAKRLREQASEQFPFLEYAVTNLVPHAEYAAEHGIPQSDFVESWNASVWRTLSDIFVIYDTRRHAATVRAVAAFAHYGAVNLLEARLDHDAYMLDTEYSEALRLATNSGYLRIVKLLLGVSSFNSLLEVDIKILLIQAMQLGDTAVFAAFLESGLHERVKEDTLSQVMMQASRANNAKAIQMMLDHGIDVSCGLYALSVSVRRGYEDIVRFLLQSGIDVNATHPTIKGYPRAIHQVLTEAVQYRHLKIVQMLVEHGADPNLEPFDPFHLPIRIACRLNLDSIAQVLLANGACLDEEGARLCFGYAFSRKNEKLIQLLLNNGADLNALSHDHWEVFRFRPGYELSRSLISLASNIQDKDMLDLLFEKGADPNVANGQEYHDALYHACSAGSIDIVRILLSHGSTVSNREPEYYRMLVAAATKLPGDTGSELLKLLFEQSNGCRAQDRVLYIGSLQEALFSGWHEAAHILKENGVAA